MLEKRDQFIQSQCDRLIGGMQKLVESSEQLAVLNEKLAVQRVAVAEKSNACTLLLTEITGATAIAEDKKAIAVQKSKDMEVQNAEIVKEKAEAEAALEEALPALEAARAALDDLNKNDVTEIRSFAKPPKPVQTICECIVVLKGIKDVSWASAKGMMSDPNFLKSLKEMDVDNITQRQVLQVKMSLKEMDMTVEEMRDKSRAGAGLMKFVEAVIGYCEVTSSRYTHSMQSETADFAPGAAVWQTGRNIRGV